MSRYDFFIAIYKLMKLNIVDFCLTAEVKHNTLYIFFLESINIGISCSVTSYPATVDK